MKKVTENNIEEQVKREIGGDIFWAYCNGIILGVKHYYRENMQKTCPFRGYVYDETALNRVKEAYNLIKDILDLDSEEDILMDEAKHRLEYYPNRYVERRRQVKRNKQRVLSGDRDFIMRELNDIRNNDCETVDDLIAKYDYEITLNNRLAKEAERVRAALTAKTIREIYEQLCEKGRELDSAKWGLENGTDLYRAECTKKIPKLERDIEKLKKQLNRV